MSREELIETLQKLQKRRDTDLTHVEADEALIKYINDPEITELYGDISKWYE